MKWPWNREKVPQRTDSGQLRDIQVRVAEMEADFDKVFHLLEKINGRTKQRSRRENLPAEEVELEADGQQPEYVMPTTENGEVPRSDSPKFRPISKAELRARARSRGLIQ